MQFPFILPRLGRWSSASDGWAIWRRIYFRGRWTPFCVVRRRYARRGGAPLTLMLLAALFAGCSGGCGARYVVRDGAALAAEVMAAEARQTEAATALFEAAQAAREAGDWAGCARYARPALLIEAAAVAQARRALWLAGISAYATGAEDADPGPDPDPRPVEEVCGPAPPDPEAEVAPAPVRVPEEMIPSAAPEAEEDVP